MGSDDHTTLGARLHQLREDDHLTLEGLAQAVEAVSGETCGKTAVSHWEKGRKAPSRAKAAALDYLFKTGSEISDGYGYPPPGVTVTQADRVLVRIDELEATIKQIVVGDGAGDDALSVVLRQMVETMKEQTAAMRALAGRDSTPARGLPSPAPARPVTKRAARSGR